MSLLAKLDSNTFEYEHRNVEKERKYTYAIFAVDEKNRTSPPAYVLVK